MKDIVAIHDHNEKMQKLDLYVKSINESDLQNIRKGIKELIQASYEKKEASFLEIGQIAEIYSRGLQKIYNNESIIKVIEERSNEIHKYYQDFLLDGKMGENEEGLLVLHICDFEFMQLQLLKNAFDQKNYVLVEQVTRITALIPNPQIRRTAVKFIRDIVCLKTYEIKDKEKLIEMLNFIQQEESVHANGKDEDVGIVEDWHAAKKIIQDIHETFECLK